MIDNKKFAVVHKDFVLDYTSPLKNVIMETESGDNGLTYRYTYGLQKESVVIYDIPNGVGSVTQNYIYPAGAADVVKLYYHHDRLGSTDFLTDNISGKVTSYITYDDFGSLTAKAIVKLGLRELDLVQEYTGHSYDQVLNLYHTKARMYDAQDRRFMAVDPIKGTILKPASLNQYAYCLNNPIKYIDPLGLLAVRLQLPKSAGGVVLNGHLTSGKAFYYEDGKYRDAPVGTNIYTGNQIYQVTKTGVVLVDSGAGSGGPSAVPKVSAPKNPAAGLQSVRIVLPVCKEGTGYLLMGKTYYLVNGVLTRVPVGTIVFMPNGDRYVLGPEGSQQLGDPIKLPDPDLLNLMYAYFEQLKCEQRIYATPPNLMPKPPKTWFEQLMTDMWADLKYALWTGDYGNDMTASNTVASLGAAFFGVDFFADANSFGRAMENGDYASAAMYFVSALPLVGAISKVSKTSVKGADAALDLLTASTKATTKTTADFMGSVTTKNGKLFAQKNIIDEIGRIESAGVDFSKLTKEVQTITKFENGTIGQAIKYSDSSGTLFVVHEVTDAMGNLIHRDFDAVRIYSGQIINKLR
jgi:RHS repeat-associated protein